MIGQQFGRLRVVAIGPRVPSSNGKQVQTVRCRCVCGTELLVRANNSKSCGCWAKELATARAAARRALRIL
jgi:hypothetical protein